jgi:hypothetical protein
MIFVKIGEHEYVNVEQIARCEFTTNNNRYQATIFLAKPGGSDRHFVYDQAARDLEEVLKSFDPKVQAEQVQAEQVQKVKKKNV